MAAELTIQLLGELELQVDGEVLPLPSSKKTRALLGYLVLAPGEISRSRLCDLLWDGPADPRAALRWSLSKLRPLVNGPEPRIRADREHVAFESAGAGIDLVEIQSALAAGTSKLDVRELEDLCARFRGELLEGLEMGDCFSFAHWLAGEREKARNLHTQLLASLTHRLRGEPARALAHARAWVAAEPLDEGAHAALISALSNLGKHAQAKRAGEVCRGLFERELGRAPGSVVINALRFLPDRGENVPAETEHAMPMDARPSRDLGLFGRVEECAAIERLFESQPESGPTPIQWFSGEAGMGKSRMLAEFLERARKRGAGTFYGKAYEAEAARPLAIWSDAVGDGLDADATTGRSKLFEQVRARLERRRTDRGLFIALDDLQWVDESSAALISWLARSATPGLFMAVAVRPGEIEDNPAAQRLTRALAREGLLQNWPLKPLEENQAQALMRSVNPDWSVQEALDLTGGNPLFAIELARLGDGGRSPRLQACISDRLDRLGPSEQDLIRVGAAMGRRFSLDLVADVSGLRIGELIRAAEGLESAGIIRPEGDGEYDFAHDLMRQAAYSEASDPARRVLHRRIAQVLSQDSGARDGLAPDLARHASLAGQHDLAARASAWAGERCLRLFAMEEATQFARRGLEHAPSMNPAESRRLSTDLLAIEVHAGLGRRNHQALHTRLEQLASQAEARDEHETARTAHYLLSVLDEESGDFECAEERTLRAVDQGREADAETQARALANSGRCLAQLERRLPKAEAFLREAAEGGGAVGIGVDLAWGAGLIAWHRGEYEKALEHLQKAHGLACERGNNWAAFECLSRMALVELELGRGAQVLQRESELRLGAKRLGGGSEPALVDALLALAQHGIEDSMASSQGLERAFDALREVDNKAVLATVLNQAARTDLDRGRHERARKWAQEALQVAGIVGRERQLARAQAMVDTLSESHRDDF